MGMGKILETNHWMTGMMTHYFKGEKAFPTYSEWGPKGPVP